jgi:methylated-DNA-[protein]-cysteine S-methyltransferase
MTSISAFAPVSTDVSTTRYTAMASPIGELVLTANDDGLTGVHMVPHVDRADLRGARRDDDDAVLAETRRQLDEYFAGDRTDFDLPLAPTGTDFQRLVWAGLCAIPYGETISYGELAERIGRPNAQRAVGLANGRNPIAVIVPCHRVIGADGSLTGYGGGLDRKQLLLGLERGVATLPL